MTNVEAALKRHQGPEDLAQAFFSDYFGEKQATYPINPFQMLTDIGVPFVFRAFKKYEGVYIPPADENDIAIVGINLKRPITRQRFTAAHELCHHIKDRDKGIVCPLGSKNQIETYAENFAAELLMPAKKLREQVNIYKKSGYVSYDDVLKISHFFGVSFESCLFRIAYKNHAIEGDTSPDVLKKNCKKYAPDKVRIAEGLNNVQLYEGLFEAAKSLLRVEPNQNISYKFENEYVYNDSRLEGIEIDFDSIAEISADIRINKQASEFCTSTYKNIVEVAGHSVMYSEVFMMAKKESITVFNLLSLNGMLFSCTPYPEFGGKIRDINTLVVGAKFETIDCNDVINELVKLDEDVKNLESSKEAIGISNYIERVIEIHHRLTVIHPFPDGNGRTTRAFLNLQLIRNGIPPIYFKVDRKDEYLKALSTADADKNFAPLYEVFFQAILRTHSELTDFPEL